MITRPDYEALDAQGLPYVRPARTIHELPSPEDRMAACASATAVVERQLGQTATRRIPFGAPVYTAFMTRPEAKKHRDSALLLTLGCDLPLSLCPEYAPVSSEAVEK